MAEAQSLKSNIPAVALNRRLLQGSFFHISEGGGGLRRRWRILPNSRRHSCVKVLSVPGFHRGKPRLRRHLPRVRLQETNGTVAEGVPQNDVQLERNVRFWGGFMPFFMVLMCWERESLPSSQLDSLQIQINETLRKSQV